MKKEFPDHWEILNKKLDYPYEFLNKIDIYQKQVNILKKEDCFSKLKNVCPDESEKETTNQNIEIFHIKNREQLTRLNAKAAIILLVDVFLRNI